MKVEVKIEGVDGVLDTLKKLPPEVVSKRGGPVRFALAKGARVIRDEARKNFTASVTHSGKTGKNWATGFTQKHIITKRRSLFDGQNGEMYVVTVRYIPHPNAHKKNKTQPWRANDAAFLLEYGSATQPAEPWLRPAYNAKSGEAIKTIESELLSRIDKIIKKLQKG